jgi:hypothetical protein
MFKHLNIKTSIKVIRIFLYTYVLLYGSFVVWRLFERSNYLSYTFNNISFLITTSFDWSIVFNILAAVLIAPILEEFVDRFWLKNSNEFSFLKVCLFAIFLYTSISHLSKYLNQSGINTFFEAISSQFMYNPYKHYIVSLFMIPILFIFKTKVVLFYTNLICSIRSGGYWILFNFIIVMMGVLSHEFIIDFFLAGNFIYFTAALIYTFLGFAIFAYFRLRFNLFTAILLHSLMNSFGMIFRNSKEFEVYKLLSVFILIPYISLLIFLILRELKKFEDLEKDISINNKDIEP